MSTKLVMTNKEATENQEKAFNKIYEITYSRPIFCNDEFQYFRCKGKNSMWESLVVLADKDTQNIKEIYNCLLEVRRKFPWKDKDNFLMILVPRQVKIFHIII